MATNPTGAALNKGLTDYAFAIYPDYAPLLADADFLAPPVVTGAGIGQYSKFDDKQAFLVYDATRAVGGKRTRIAFAGSTGTFNCDPKALEIGIDGQERTKAGDGQRALEENKIRTLISTFATSRFSRVYTKATTSGNYTAATADKTGQWSNPNVDPVADVEAACVQIYDATGVLPNRMTLDIGSWIKAKNNPNVMKRQYGVVNTGVTLPQFSAMMAFPLEIRLATGMTGTTGFGSSTTTKKAIQSATALVFFAQSNATQYDPSALKTFTPNAQSFDAVFQYRDESCNSDIYYIEVGEDIESISSSLLVKISVS